MENAVITGRTLMQKGDVILSKDGAQWMELAFEKAIKKNGEIPNAFTRTLYQGKKI